MKELSKVAFKAAVLLVVGCSRQPTYHLDLPANSHGSLNFFCKADDKVDVPLTASAYGKIHCPPHPSHLIVTAAGKPIQLDGEPVWLTDRSNFVVGIKIKLR